jgi:hypothetical protein
VNVAAFHYDLMGELARSEAIKSFLEIGVSAGGSFLATVAGGLSTLRRVVACDTWGPTHGGKDLGSHQHIDDALDALEYRGERVFMDGPSSMLVAEYARGHEPVDLLHVDADHSYDGALSDLRVSWPLVGRWLVVHDVFMPPVWGALAQFSGEHAGELDRFEISAHGTGTAVLRRAV